MFKDNKYTKWYKLICEKEYTGYTELHHYIPKSLGGSDDLSNLVKLSPKAHFICHWLLIHMLAKRNDKEKMIYAFNFMLKKPKDHIDKRYYPCSRVYEIARTMMMENAVNNHIDVRKKISESRKKAWQNPTEAMILGIEKMRQSKIGKSPWNKGKPGKKWTSEQREKLMSIRAEKRKYRNANST